MTPKTRRARYGYFEPPEPSVRLDAETRHATLAEDLRYWSPGGLAHSAPAGWTSDGASIPRPLWSITGGPWDDPDVRLPAIIHDRLCYQAGRTGGPWGLRARQYADRLFRVMILAAGGGHIKASVYSAAVRIGTLALRLRGEFRDDDDGSAMCYPGGGLIDA